MTAFFGHVKPKNGSWHVPGTLAISHSRHFSELDLYMIFAGSGEGHMTGFSATCIQIMAPALSPFMALSPFTGTLAIHAISFRFGKKGGFSSKEISGPIKCPEVKLRPTGW